MKKLTLIVSLATLVSGSATAQDSMSDVICRGHEFFMAGAVLAYRDQGMPVSNAESIFNSEEDVRTRVFLKQVTREIYADPEVGRQYIESGQFRQACVKTHRGF